MEEVLMTVASPEHLRQLPKVELHCHVEGAARATTIGELAAKNGVRFPVDDPADLYQFTSLNQFLSIYDTICASLRTADDFRRITYEALEDGAAAGVRYREMFFSPGFVIRLGVPVETEDDVVPEGLEQGTGMSAASDRPVDQQTGGNRCEGVNHLGDHDRVVREATHGLGPAPLAGRPERIAD